MRTGFRGVKVGDVNAIFYPEKWGLCRRKYASNDLWVRMKNFRKGNRSTKSQMVPPSLLEDKHFLLEVVFSRRDR